MPRPTPTTALQEDLYASMGPLAYDDANQDWALLKYCGAMAKALDTVNKYASDDGDYPGWSILLDADRCPEEALPYLAQFVGVTPLAGLSVADQRIRIKSSDGMKRGTLTSLVAAIQATLTGAKTVFIGERNGSAYRLGVGTYPSETPDPAATLAAIIAQKPAGIVLDYAVAAAVTYTLVRVKYSDYDDVKATFLTYNGLSTDTPGT